MHVISKKKLQDFWEIHAGAKSPLLTWFKAVTETDFEGFNHLREGFPSADLVDGLVVFNIGGNKYRLIAAIHFNRRKLFIRHVLTHAEYDRGKWKGT